ncbi:hypothetical protein [Kitasatospora sp. MBT66]|uniref:hypothetical protein n=1 Tax=Kitasatospora sp. MBT66 TaxID=1444769 RepID=UPI0005B7EBC4|nr:hypothetical protein [Kitasatospora sp. MBT66]
MSNPSSARRALGPGASRALGPQRPRSRQQPPWAGPAAVPDPPARPSAPQAAQRPAEQAVDAIAALRHVRAPAAVLPQYLAAARTPPPPPPPARLRTVPSPTISGTGTLAG